MKSVGSILTSSWRGAAGPLHGALRIDPLHQRDALRLGKLQVRHGRKQAGQVLEGFNGGIRIPRQFLEERFAGFCPVAHRAVLIEDRLSVAGGSPRP